MSIIASLLCLLIPATTVAAPAPRGSNVSEDGRAELNLPRGTDTVGVAPLVQTLTNSFAASSPATDQPTVQPFSGWEVIGNAVFADDGRDFVTYVLPTEVDGKLYFIVEVSALGDPSGFYVPWVQAGQLARGGDPLVSWRLDIGSESAPADPIEPGSYLVVKEIAVKLFDFSGVMGEPSNFSSFVLPNSNNRSTPTSLAATVVVENTDVPGSPSDIAGYPLTSIQVIFEYEPALFVDGFESGSTNGWASSVSGR